jgi:hypothetical protein
LPPALDSARANGIDCYLEKRGEGTELTPGVDLVAHRFIEVSMETAARYRAKRCNVTIEYRPHALELDVRRDRTVSDAEQSSRSLVERAALYDGRVRWVEERGQFQITARLPLLQRAAL